jgi:hypothetical protein
MNHSPPAVMPASTVLGAQPEQTAELRYEVRWSDGRRLVSRLARSVDAHQAKLLVEGKICEWKDSPSGIPRYLKLRRNPPANFASILAQANFTITTTGNLREHISSKAKGL